MGPLKLITSHSAMSDLSVNTVCMTKSKAWKEGPEIVVAFIESTTVIKLAYLFVGLYMSKFNTNDPVVFLK